MLGKIRKDLLSELGVIGFKTNEKCNQIIYSFNGMPKSGLNKVSGLRKLPVPGSETDRQPVDCRFQQVVHAFCKTSTHVGKMSLAVNSCQQTNAVDCQDPAV